VAQARQAADGVPDFADTVNNVTRIAYQARAMASRPTYDATRHVHRLQQCRSHGGAAIPWASRRVSTSVLRAARAAPGRHGCSQAQSTAYPRRRRRGVATDAVIRRQEAIAPRDASCRI
jgi:hypothetical protein